MDPRWASMQILTQEGEKKGFFSVYATESFT